MSGNHVVAVVKGQSGNSSYYAVVGANSLPGDAATLTITFSTPSYLPTDFMHTFVRQPRRELRLAVPYHM